ncbi:hypothetical protein O2W15_02120 [Modestobacter sp. VKM Ac-2979]|uniref:hypothetical protein n=1 Tax=unclassified Modestobacter TaxID=2643866 RepID=UPI0022AB6F11|nr:MULTISPECIES: hypothetical protein [unclassified Modestobacter]MCZ2810222.1 hypothetical protein [Modestobacter sp. VKM Ac-2979]MCZ2841708.1 hypothetical protein [Modestobacter sp. VKM Ac-2980]
MDIAAVVAIVAAGISLVALVAAFYQAKSAKDQVTEAREQTELQRQMHRDATEPYVWADIRPDEGHGQLLKVVVQNGGPTVAEDIRVSFDPPLRDASERDGGVFSALDGGISALAPGRWMTWSIGDPNKVITDDAPTSYSVTVDAVGSFGAIKTLRYTIDLSQWAETSGVPLGTLHEVRNAITDVTKAIKGGGV